MASSEIIGRHAGPAEAVETARQTLGSYYDQLVESGSRPREVGEKIEVQGYVSPTGAIGQNDYGYDEAWERSEIKGSVRGITIRRDLVTGEVSYAWAHGYYPASLTKEESGFLFRSDTWYTDIHFPARHHDSEVQRLVVNSYRTPLTKLSLAVRAMASPQVPEELDAYNELHQNMTVRKNAAGIPLGAEDVKHEVYGRGRRMTPEAIASLNATLGTFATGLEGAIVFHQRIDAELAAEAAMAVS